MRSFLHLLSKELPGGLCPEVRKNYKDNVSLLMLFCMTKCMFLTTFWDYLMVSLCVVQILYFIIMLDCLPINSWRLGEARLMERLGIDSCVSFWGHQSLHHHLTVPWGGLLKNTMNMRIKARNGYDSARGSHSWVAKSQQVVSSVLSHVHTSVFDGRTSSYFHLTYQHGTPRSPWVIK